MIMRSLGDDDMMFKRYEIDVTDALKEYKSSEQFMRQLGSGRYAYVEKHFCLNLPKYIKWDAAAATLTDYAREHKDECCLSFITIVTGGWACDQNRDSLGFVIQPSVSDPEYHDNPTQVPEHIKQFAEVSNAVMSLAGELPNNFPKMLDKLIASKGVKEEDLAWESNLSEKTIQRLRHHDQKRIELETVIQLCLGLHLHPILSGYLLRAAGQQFMDTNLHNMYKFLLCSCYEYSVGDCNALLTAQNFPTLGKTKKD